MAGTTVPAIQDASSNHVHVIPDPTHLHVDMDMTGKNRCVILTLQRTLIVEIRLVCMDPESLL